MSSQVSSFCAPSTCAQGPAAQACISPAAWANPCGFPALSLKGEGGGFGMFQLGLLHNVCVCVCVRACARTNTLVFWLAAAGLREKVGFQFKFLPGVTGSCIFGGGGGRATNDVYKLPWIQFQCWPQRALWHGGQAAKRDWDTVAGAGPAESRLHALKSPGRERRAAQSWNPLQLAGTKPLKSSLESH